MEDLSEKLAEILNDPKRLDQVRAMADSLLRDEPDPKADANGTVDLPAAEDIGRMMGILSQLKKRGNDPRSQLLLALRPHLSEPRQKKLDTALKLLRLVELLPVLRQSGFLDW